MFCVQLQEVTEGYKGLERVTRGSKGLLIVTRGYRELEGFTGDSKRKYGVRKVTADTGG